MKSLRSFCSPDCGARRVVLRDLEGVAAERDPPDRLVRTRSDDNRRRAHDRAFLGLQELNRQCKENTHVALTHPYDPAFRNYQRSVAELSQLSDRELADIGLNRTDIPCG